MDALIFDGDADVEVRSVDVAVDLHVVAVFAVGEVADALPHEAFGAVEDRFGDAVDVGEFVVGEELAEAFAADFGGAGHGAEVAEEEFGGAAVGADDLEGEGVFAARFVEFEGGHAEAFAEDVVAFDLAWVAADVGHVRHRSQEGDQAASDEEWHQQDVVGEVPGAEPRVVGGEHVPWLEGVDGETFKEQLGGPRQHDAEVRGAPARLTDGAPLGIGEDAGEIAPFAEDGAEGGLDDDVVDLVHDRD